MDIPQHPTNSEEDFIHEGNPPHKHPHGPAARAARCAAQFKQPVPQGFERLSLWPAELYDQVAPPKNPRHNPIAK